MSANDEGDWRILSKRLWTGMAFWVGMDLYELLELVVLLDDERREQAIAGLLVNAYRRSEHRRAGDGLSPLTPRAVGSIARRVEHDSSAMQAVGGYGS